MNGPINVVVIDDDEDSAETIKSLVSLHGKYKVIQFQEVQQLHKHISSGERVDLIITDLFMPFSDGYDVLREYSQTLPIWVISGGPKANPAGTSPSLFLSSAKSLGANKSFQKPIDPRLFRTCLDMFSKEILDS